MAKVRLARTVLTQCKKWLAPLGLAVFVSACSELPPPEAIDGEVRELRFQVEWVPAHPNQTPARLRERVKGVVDHLEQQFSSEFENSEVSRLNRWESTEPLVLTRELEDFLRIGLQAYDMTDGHLPVFTNGTSQSAPLVRVENHLARKSAADVKVDMNLLLEGYIVDRIADLMEQMSIQHYRISVNQQVRVRGQQRKKTPWLVADSVEKFVVRDRAIGQISVNDSTDVLVIHRSAATANALSYWLSSLAAEEAIAQAERLRIPVVIEIRENGVATRYTSRAFQSYLS
ncbi:MAG: FAD:protein FMN transferase [Idiomarina sp.]|nr:FAD:protein FMN transferase [Idiomarina sp.]